MASNQTLSNVPFPLLQDIDIQNVEETPVIQASQAGLQRELQCVHARENVRTINASAKGQESLAQPSVTQQLDHARINLEGHIAYTFSCSFIHCCKCCHMLGLLTLRHEFMLKESNVYENFKHLC